ncbi:gamma carbonic anhydrase family protein [Leptospira wolffii]|uniref:gamma carbonic anhydrase family protein n=1 Tax=Leptospira wolffii TaxID=409998 RepID=UPI0010825850|nr:gamma carbonic anhydrase family protein [Leptospira wolffii]TGK60168.1 gamma carbonic anhydrase family protein [Leptospira wolffii]TGK72510.1 gamma carbonic anhydrase family protein [Leptospira wolffii]TGK76175.1 gamma carbonic anhydrase family protein [Leptospira wolffii]TGL30427.1 gamma carbonic anhydrase family protein [Leptospira wolffii]
MQQVYKAGNILEYMGKRPVIGEEVFLAPGSQVVGDVIIGKNSSIWFQTLIRGDVNYIRIGENVNIQDMTVVHVSKDHHPVEIGNNVSIGHRAVIHGCKLRDNSFVGMGAILMDGVELGEYAFVAAGAMVTPGKIIPPGSMVMGSPGKVVREITDKERQMIEKTTANYVNYKNNYLQDYFYRISGV